MFNGSTYYVLYLYILHFYFVGQNGNGNKLRSLTCLSEALDETTAAVADPIGCSTAVTVDVTLVWILDAGELLSSTAGVAAD